MPKKRKATFDGSDSEDNIPLADLQTTILKGKDKEQEKIFQPGKSSIYNQVSQMRDDPEQILKKRRLKKGKLTTENSTKETKEDNISNNKDNQAGTQKSVTDPSENKSKFVPVTSNLIESGNEEEICDSEEMVSDGKTEVSLNDSKGENPKQVNRDEKTLEEVTITRQVQHRVKKTFRQNKKYDKYEIPQENLEFTLDNILEIFRAQILSFSKINQSRDQILLNALTKLIQEILSANNNIMLHKVLVVFLIYKQTDFLFIQNVGKKKGQFLNEIVFSVSTKEYAGSEKTMRQLHKKPVIFTINKEENGQERLKSVYLKNLDSTLIPFNSEQFLEKQDQSLKIIMTRFFGKNSNNGDYYFKYKKEVLNKIIVKYAGIKDFIALIPEINLSNPELEQKVLEHLGKYTLAQTLNMLGEEVLRHLNKNISDFSIKLRNQSQQAISNSPINNKSGDTFTEQKNSKFVMKDCESDTDIEEEKARISGKNNEQIFDDGGVEAQLSNDVHHMSHGGTFVIRQEKEEENLFNLDTKQQIKPEKLPVKQLPVNHPKQSYEFFQPGNAVNQEIKKLENSKKRLEKLISTFAGNTEVDEEFIDGLQKELSNTLTQLKTLRTQSTTKASIDLT